jgi:hypothetical protein
MDLLVFEPARKHGEAQPILDGMLGKLDGQRDILPADSSGKLLRARVLPSVLHDRPPA